MTAESTDRITFEVETTRVLQILSREIYDSPLALLRENLQNAYDAILMRCATEGRQQGDCLIDVQVSSDGLVITDDGIGMTEEVLRNNFWKAGSSGKRNELAYRSGVIGTFGIGAMANFGVSTRLTVETRSIGSDETLTSIAERDKLSIARECIELRRSKDDRPPGTRLVVELDDENRLTVAAAEEYLHPYVRFLPVPVRLNGKLISQQSIHERFSERVKGTVELPSVQAHSGVYRAVVEPLVDPSGKVFVRVHSVRLGETDVRGELALVQGGGHLMGLRNFFGLAPVPVSGHYQFGGVANLNILQPTAGREALSRESIEHVHRLIALIESAVSERVADDKSAADRNQGFHHYLTSSGRYELARNVTVEVAPVEKSIPLGEVKEFCAGKTVHYYPGRDPSIIQTFASPDSCLLCVSQGNPRRQIQLRYIQGFLGIPEVPDRPTIIKEFSPVELRVEEAALAVRIAVTLADDYLIPYAEVRFAQISHNVNVLVEKQKDTLVIHLARESSVLAPVLRCYQTSHEVFAGFVKDFVRAHLYRRFSDHVPSATREGAEALAKILQRNRELFRYEDSELGNLEPLLADYLAGDMTLGEVLRSAKQAARPQTVTVRKDQVGSVEQALPDVVDSPAGEGAVEGKEYEAAPAIMRPDVACDMKILVTDKKYPQLNGFEVFLGLSDRLFKLEADFFKSPHTTRVIWASHRVIYIFGHASGRLTLYYDIELKEPLKEQKAGGLLMPTTTLFTKGRIYVPVPDQLVQDFRINEGSKEFFVRFDTILG